MSSTEPVETTTPVVPDLQADAEALAAPAVEAPETEEPEAKTPVTAKAGDHGHIAPQERRRTADEDDEHRDWVIQAGDGTAENVRGAAFPRPAAERQHRRYNPAELPDPAVAKAAGLIPQTMHPAFVDSRFETQGPSGAVALADPQRDLFRDGFPEDIEESDED